MWSSQTSKSNLWCYKSESSYFRTGRRGYWLEGGTRRPLVYWCKMNRVVVFIFWYFTYCVLLSWAIFCSCLIHTLTFFKNVMGHVFTLIKKPPGAYFMNVFSPQQRKTKWLCPALLLPQCHSHLTIFRWLCEITGKCKA